MEINTLPLISVVTPVYNRQKLIVDAIQSVLSQSYPFWELIIVDDCSTDETFSTISSFSDNRIKPFKLDKNQERGAARNFGIEKSTGELIAFLDSDDLFLIDHLKIIADAWVQHNYKDGLYFTNSLLQINNEPPIEKIVPKLFGNNFSYLMHWTPNPARVALTKKVIAEYRFDPSIPGLEDVDLWLRIVTKYPIFHITKYTSIYRLHDDSYTLGSNDRYLRELNFFNLIFNKAELKQLLPSKDKRRLISMCHFHISRHYFMRGKKLQTIYHSLSSFLKFPSSYNKKTNKIIFVQSLYSIPFFGSVLRQIIGFKHRKKITILPPKNLETWMTKFYQKNSSWTIYQSQTKFLRNVFISNSGLVLKNFTIQKRSGFNLFGLQDSTYGFSFWKLILEQYLVCRFGKSLKSIKLNDANQYFIIHSKWFNYSFWINSYLVRLNKVKEEYGLKNVILIYPEEWSAIPFINQSLEAFDVKKIIIPSDHHVFVKNLIFPQTRAWSTTFDPDEILKLRNYLIPIALSKSNIKSKNGRIYLSRQQRKVRCVDNEEELLPLLKFYDFEIIHFEKLNFWDQITIMNNASIFISIHGAGFSNCIFMQPSSCVMELVNSEYANLEYKFPFWKLASIVNLNYFVQFGNIKSNVKKLRRGAKHDLENEYLVDQNIKIELNLFQHNIELMIKKTNEK